jgi:predicted PurR-regulated permease PerM
MNFIPYIGDAIVCGTLFAVGLLSFATLGQALVAPLAYIAATTLEGQFITPSIIGHRLTLNPFLIFVSIAFWAWMWGPIGAFLAVPLVMSAMVAARHLLGDPHNRFHRPHPSK